MEYRASLDNVSKVITVVCFLFIGFLIYRNAALVRISPLFSILIALFFFGIFIASYLYGPNKYLVKNGMLIIVRPINKISIPLADIKEARILKKDELGTIIRTSAWGAGGLFGYYGNFRSLRIGKMKLYTTRRDRRILITTTDDDLIIISPDDVSILDELKS
ncbi:MAG: hypothetical protein H0X41_06340 [Chitinophagaceae bacterium]|nr:hypothetical protein [Chitinophagaceae bacterium]